MARHPDAGRKTRRPSRPRALFRNRPIVASRNLQGQCEGELDGEHSDPQTSAAGRIRKAWHSVAATTARPISSRVTPAPRMSPSWTSRLRSPVTGSSRSPRASPCRPGRSASGPAPTASTSPSPPARATSPVARGTRSRSSTSIAHAWGCRAPRRPGFRSARTIRTPGRGRSPSRGRPAGGTSWLRTSAPTMSRWSTYGCYLTSLASWSLNFLYSPSASPASKPSRTSLTTPWGSPTKVDGMWSEP
jgi:hypothetical protein